MSSGLPSPSEHLGDRPGGLDRAVEARAPGSGNGRSPPRWRARAAAKPTSSTPRVPCRAWNTARRRPSPCASTSSPTGASMPACARASTTSADASIRGIAPWPNAAARSRRRCRNADRSVRCARRSLARLRTRRAPVGMAGPGVDLGGLAGQRVGHIDLACRRLRDTVAAVAEPRDAESLNHGWPRAGIRDCRRRRRSAKGGRQPRASRACARSLRCPRTPPHATAGSRTMPFFTRPRPTSNCGLISATSCAGAARGERAGGSTSFSEMKLTSMTTRSGGSGKSAALESADIGILAAPRPRPARACARAIGRGRHRPHRSRRAPRASSTSVKPPVEAPTSRQIRRAGSKRK